MSAGSRVFESSMRAGARDCTRKAKEARDAWDRLRNKESQYAKAILAVAEVHERAVKVYSAALRDLEQHHG